MNEFRSYSVEKVRTLATLFVSTFVFGFLAGAPNGASPIKPAAALIGLFSGFSLILKWCRIDADQHNVRLWRLFPLLTVVFPGPLVTVPCHLYRSRRKKFVAALLLFMVAAISLVVTALAAMYCAENAGRLR